MRFLEFLDGLEAMVGKGRKVPGTKKSIVQRDEIAEYVDQLRTSVPQELYDAKQILNRGESIVKGAESIAKQIHSEALQEHRQKVDDSEILSKAQEEATQIKVDAEKTADQIRNRARSDAAKTIIEVDDYAEKSMSKLATQLESVRNQMTELHEDLTGIEKAVEAGKKYLQIKKNIEKAPKAKRNIEAATTGTDTIMENTEPYQIQMNGLKNHAST
jgi:cell division septum initiation protein DivIVA